MSNVYGIDIGTSNFLISLIRLMEIRRIQAIMISILQFLLMLLK